jgi:hypothetical protein
MSNLAQSDWADEPCKGRLGHEPCGQTNWDCRCPTYGTAKYRKREIRDEIKLLEAELKDLG